MTETEFLQLPDDGIKREFVAGEAREVPTSSEHDVIGAIIIGLLTPHAEGEASGRQAYSNFP